MALSDDVSRIAGAAGRYAAPDEALAAVMPVEPAPGQRLYLCAYEAPDGTQGWLVLDDSAQPVTRRQTVRDAVSIAALVEVAEENLETEEREEPRLASPDQLDGHELGADAASALQTALPAIDELTRDVELHYKLELD